MFFQSYILNVKGVSAVEFSLIAPVLIFLLAGVVDIGFFISERMEVHNLAHVTAEYVVQVQDDSQMQTVGREAYRGDFSDITMSSIFECECSNGVALSCPVDCGSDDYQRRFVTVSVSGDFTPLFPYPGLPDDIVLQSDVRMRVD